MTSSLVYIRVTAPKNILSRTLEDVPCDVENTWSEFLTHICKLKIEPNSDLLIRTVARLSKGGWQAKLEDKVQDFVKKFTYARKTYTIHLESDTVRNLEPTLNLHGFPHKKNDFIFTRTGAGTSGIVTRQQRRASEAFDALKTKESSNKHDDPKDNSTGKKQLRPQSLKLVSAAALSVPGKRKQMAVTPYPVSLQPPSVMQKCKEPAVASSIPRAENGATLNKENSYAGTGNEHENCTKRTKKWPEDAYRVDSGDKDDDKRIANYPVRWSFNDDNDDAMSTLTSVSMVERDLNRDGIDNAEIKPEVVQRLVRNFDNSAMLRIQHELRGLVTNGSWHRLTARVPRTGHLLQDIFQIYPTNTR